MIKYRIHHNRKNRLKQDGTALVQIELFDNANRKYFSTSISVEPKFWNDETKKILYKHPRADEYNLILDDLVQKINSILRKGKLLEKAYSVEEVIDQINQNNTDLLYDFITSELEKDQQLKRKTIMDLLNTRNRLSDFKPEAKLQDIDYKFVVDFDNHLRRIGYSINTIGKLHKNLKRFLNLAINYGILEQKDYPYRKFRVKREVKKREALSAAEISALSKLSYPTGSINEIVKDMFLLACYTGLRISDVTRLQPSHCKFSEKGYSLQLKTFKARKMAYLPIHSLFQDGQIMSRPERIIDRYLNKQEGYIFPRIPESKINRHLKEIAKQAGIVKTVTFHMGRHSFGTILASIVPLPVLQTLMQHSDVKTTMIYVNMSNDIIDENLGKVEWNS